MEKEKWFQKVIDSKNNGKVRGGVTFLLPEESVSGYVRSELKHEIS